jgi:superoxide dismutase, Fe-Mn family
MALRTLASKKTLSLALGGGARPLAAARGMATTVSLPDLPYDFSALEPAISGEIMSLHHQKHHATYVANYNKALEQLDASVSKGDASAVVQLQGSIKFNGGGERSLLPNLGPSLF